MKSLPQIRAANALAAKVYPGIGTGQNEGDVLSGFAHIVVNNGLLAAAASAVERNKSEKLKHVGEFAVIYALARHFSSEGVGIYVPAAPLPDTPQSESEWVNYRDDILHFIRFLSDGQPSVLRRATSESVAYLSYLKRFVA